MKDVREVVSDLVGAGLLAAMERSGVVVIWRAELDAIREGAPDLRAELERARADLGESRILAHDLRADLDKAHGARDEALGARDEALGALKSEAVANSLLREELQSAQEKLIEAEAAAVPREPLPEPPGAEHWRGKYEREKSARRRAEALLKEVGR